MDTEDQQVVANPEGGKGMNKIGEGDYFQLQNKLVI